MKKFNKLIHIFTFLSLFSFLLLSCGTEEDPANAVIEVTVSSASVTIGNPVTFTATSSIEGDITSSVSFIVNGTEITGNTYTPTVVNTQNQVYTIYNGAQSNTATFASVEAGGGETEGYTQKVLLEDYTGTWCGYCPRMVTIIDYLTEYNENIIPVAIHCPGAPTDPWAYEFANQLSHPNNYNVPGRPEGRYNRINVFDMHVGTQPCPNNAEAYYTQADSFLNRTAPLGLAINSRLNGGELNINVKVGFAADDISDARLVVYLIEDGLTYNQVNYYAGQSATCDPNYDYVNQPNPMPNFKQEHILLKTFTDIFGDVIPTDQVVNGNIWSRELNVPLPANVSNANNLTIVAFVLGNGTSVPTRGVLNVQKAKVGTNQDFD